MDQEFLDGIAEQFTDIPMDELISGPLIAHCDPELKTALAGARYIRFAGFALDADGGLPQVKFEWQRGDAAAPEILQVPIPGASAEDLVQTLEREGGGAIRAQDDQA
ncbi:hypothetical protein CKO44_10215 [Rubrivivax gelatinosus]|uniref:Uncharacterized protein n=1 Tax=Rubrivivax gelatinosus TaxID=28068 RepID=A0ABS1E0L0_RUBGE|nr:hypothetical protein [Rubrivivax gelatinosus]MBK1613842.1 hypothetical protein [Rubrivivax gelatinosus]MBK1715559.1 hypothetical protein [Rubrivivax gelatinosus]